MHERMHDGTRSKCTNVMDEKGQTHAIERQVNGDQHTYHGDNKYFDGQHSGSKMWPKI